MTDSLPQFGAATTDQIGPAAGALTSGDVVLWSQIDKVGAAPSDVAAAPASHTHPSSDITDYRPMTPLAARTSVALFSDYTYVSTVQGPFLRTAILAATANVPDSGAVSANHPGVEKWLSSASADSGIGSNTSISIVLAGYEIHEAVLRTPAIFTAKTMKIGFASGYAAADPVDGIFFKYSGSGAVTANTISSATGSSTASSTIATLSASTWYFFRIVVNASVTSVAFSIYNDAGTQQGSTATITTDIPTATLGAGAITTSGGLLAQELCHMDFQCLSMQGRVLARGAVS